MDSRQPRGARAPSQVRGTHHHESLRLNGDSHGLTTGYQCLSLGDLHLDLLHRDDAQQPKDQIRRAALLAREYLNASVPLRERGPRAARIQLRAARQRDVQHRVGARRERQPVRQRPQRLHAGRSQRKAHRRRSGQRPRHPCRFPIQLLHIKIIPHPFRDPCCRSRQRSAPSHPQIGPRVPSFTSYRTVHFLRGKMRPCFQFSGMLGMAGAARVKASKGRRGLPFFSGRRMILTAFPSE